MHCIVNTQLSLIFRLGDTFVLTLVFNFDTEFFWHYVLAGIMMERYFIETSKDLWFKAETQRVQAKGGRVYGARSSMMR